jgi:hypothetical protein
LGELDARSPCAYFRVLPRLERGACDAQPVSTQYFRGVEFMLGPVNVKQGKAGCLVVDATEVRLIDDRNCKSWNDPTKLPKLLVAIQLVSVTKVTNTIERNGPNATDIMAFGVFGLAMQNRDEHVFVASETADTAAVVVFRVQKNMSPAITTAIEFAASKAKARD